MKKFLLMLVVLMPLGAQAQWGGGNNSHIVTTFMGNNNNNNNNNNYNPPPPPQCSNPDHIAAAKSKCHDVTRSEDSIYVDCKYGVSQVSGWEQVAKYGFCIVSAQKKSQDQIAAINKKKECKQLLSTLEKMPSGPLKDSAIAAFKNKGCSLSNSSGSGHGVNQVAQNMNSGHQLTVGHSGAGDERKLKRLVGGINRTLNNLKQSNADLHQEVVTKLKKGDFTPVQGSVSQSESRPQLARPSGGFHRGTASRGASMSLTEGVAGRGIASEDGSVQSPSQGSAGRSRKPPQAQTGPIFEDAKELMQANPRYYQNWASQL